MKFGAAVCLGFLAVSVSPAAAQTATPWKVAQAATGATQSANDAASASQSTASVKRRHHKKPVAHQEQQPAQRSGAAIVHEGGKTCSGLDEYRVCW